MPLADVAIYAPFAAQLLADPDGPGIGGAEMQMSLLAAALAARGLDVCQIVYPAPGLPESRDEVRIVRRDPSAHGPLAEARAIARALHAANARICVHRGAGPEVGVTALVSRLLRRRFVYSASSTLDFTGTIIGSRRGRGAYLLGLRLADTVVVQTREQAGLARRHRRPEAIEVVPSIAVPAARGDDGELFLWAGRAASYKDPLSFVRLARELPEARFAMAVIPCDAPDHAVALSEIESAAAGLRNLRLLAPLPHQELLDLIACAVAVVNTSPAEGMPNTFLEGWARGVPALALNIDPDGRLSQAGMGIAADGDWGRFVAAARELWVHRTDAEHKRNRIRAAAERDHSPATVAEDWVRLLSALS